MRPYRATSILFYCSTSILALTTGYLASQYSKIPEIIATHYSGSSADGYGPKRMLWLNLIINLGILSFVGYIIWNPKLFKTMKNYLEDSQIKAIKNRQLLLSVLLFIVTLVLCGSVTLVI